MSIGSEKANSLPLNRRRRLPRNIVDHAGYSRHFVDHPVRNPIEKFVR